MPSRWFRFIDGEKVELGVSDTSTEAKCPAIHADEMDPLRHPVTGKIYTSVSQYKCDTKRMGYEIMGTEIHGKQVLPDIIGEKQILDACERAETIQADPSKLRAFYNRNDMIRAKLERQQVIDGNRR